MQAQVHGCRDVKVAHSSGQPSSDSDLLPAESLRLAWIPSRQDRLERAVSRFEVCLSQAAQLTLGLFDCDA